MIFWRDKDMSADVTVRPDGMISLPLINEVQAEGLTPDQLRDQIAQRAARYIADPTVSIVVARSTAARYSSPVRSTSQAPTR